MKKIIYPNGIFFDVLFIFIPLMLGVASIFIFQSMADKQSEYFFEKVEEHDGHLFIIITLKNNDEKFVHHPNCPCKNL